MNKNGFTLVELIAVIVILGLLALIANSSVINVVKNSKSDLYNTQLKLIESAAESWGNDNLDKLPNDGECKYLTLANLKNYGLMEEKILNPKTNKEFSDDLYIKITSKINSSGVLKTSYKVDDNVNGCTEALPPVCTLAADSEKTGFEYGAKYDCKVKEVMETGYENGYTFYVLGKNEDGTINLIMNQNINSDGTPAGMNGIENNGNNIYNLVAWDSSASNTNGPVTAIEFLYNATKDWTNINPLNYRYNDREYQNIATDNTTIGYTSFVSNEGILTITALSGTTTIIGTKEEPLRTRMPIYSGVWNGDWQENKATEKGEVADKTDTNAYLYENINPNGNSLPYGYWILSSMNYTNRAWAVIHRSVVYCYDTDYADFFGVRPVITLHDYQIR